MILYIIIGKKWAGVWWSDAKYQSFLIVRAYFGGVFQFRFPDVGQCFSFLPDDCYAELVGF